MHSRTTSPKKKNNTRVMGFTLLEMVIAIGIFSFIMVMAVGITIGISNAQAKAASIQSVIDNVRFSLELITRELRTGTKFSLAQFGCIGITGNGVSFVDQNQNPPTGQSRYYFPADTDGNGQTDTIKRVALSDASPIDSGNCTLAEPLTSEDVQVDGFIFLLEGSLPGPGDGQPRITISLNIKSKNPKIQADTAMKIQTTVIPRLRDL